MTLTENRCPGCGDPTTTGRQCEACERCDQAEALADEADERGAR